MREENKFKLTYIDDADLQSHYHDEEIMPEENARQWFNTMTDAFHSICKNDQKHETHEQWNDERTAYHFKLDVFPHIVTTIKLEKTNN